MKRLLGILSLLLLAMTTACSADGGSDAAASPLVVSGGDTNMSYTRADLEALGAAESAFKGTAYVGVPVADLLEDAGFDPATVTAVKAVAADGFTANYEPDQVLADGVIVAYASPDGDMPADDGDFRMVLPDEEGRLNVRLLVELQVTQ